MEVMEFYQINCVLKTLTYGYENFKHFIVGFRHEVVILYNS